MTARPELAYFGPQGTFTHLVARERYGDSVSYVPVSTIEGVLAYVKGATDRIGIVPLENTAGGPIFDTMDLLITDPGPLRIQEQLQVCINLALMSKQPLAEITEVYSHFAPLKFCQSWLAENLPQAMPKRVGSTAEAARKAAETPGAAAIGTRNAAAENGLELLLHPIPVPVQNVTWFVTVGHGDPGAGDQTTFIVELEDNPGSLCDFLTPFRDGGINLSRIVSRSVPGAPGRYMFYVDVNQPDATVDAAAVFARAQRHCAQMINLGTYPKVDDLTV
jgi:prephenate dehydratase